MRTFAKLSLIVLPVLLGAGPAAAQQAAVKPLTLGGVFGDAALEVQVVMGGLILSGITAVVVWALALGRTRHGGLNASPTGLTFLKAVSGAAPLFGLAAAAYTLLMSALGLANVRPTPSLAVIAPGLAEALLSVFLGLLAAAVATTLRRHLEGRLDLRLRSAEAS